MSVKVFNTRIQLKHDVNTGSDGWASQNGQGLVLLTGEFAWDSTNNNFKVGDGTSAWSALPYAIGASVLKGYTAISTGTAQEVTNADSLNIAIAKLQKQIKDEAAAGVRSIGGTTGTVTLGNGLQASGNANGEISAKVVTANGLSVGNDGITMSLASASANGAMLSTDFSKLAGIANGAQVNVLEGVQVNGTDLVIDSNKKVNITVAEGTANGTIKVNSTDIAVHGLGSAAYTPSTDYATSAQGTKADSALQSISRGSDGSYVTTTIGTKDSNNDQSVGVAVTVQDVSTADSSHMGLAEASDVKTYVDTAINDALDSEVTFKGVTSTLPNNPKNGDMWKTSAAVTVPAESAGEGSEITTKAGDTIIYKNIDSASNNGWYVIPSADDVEDTWRAIKVNGTEILGSGTSTGDVDFVAGSNITITADAAISPATGKTITVAHSTTAAAEAAAVKVGNDTTGHVIIGDALQASDIARTATTGDHPIAATNVESALVELKTAIDTSDSNAVTGVTLNGTSVVTNNTAAITTGTTDDIAMTSNGGQITASLVEFDSFIFDCGSATTNTTQSGTQFANKSSHAQ